MTAAHCVHSTSPGDVEVHGGSNTLSSGGALYPVDRIIVNEKYDDGTQDNDVALLHLAARFPGQTSRLLTAADANRYAPAGALATVIGWGLTSEDVAEVSNILRRVNVQIVSNKTCNAAYANTISDVMLCAGFARGGKDACQGDSGGPLVVSDGRGGYFQAGIVSWGEGCARPNKYGVYTRVSMFQAWVASKIAGRGVEPWRDHSGRACMSTPPKSMRGRRRRLRPCRRPCPRGPKIFAAPSSAGGRASRFACLAHRR